MKSNIELIEANLTAILIEVREQSNVGDCFPPDAQSFEEQVEQVREWVEDAGEYGIAYELLVSILEGFPFQLSSQAAIKLLEVGLLMRFKTEKVQDEAFDFR